MMVSDLSTLIQSSHTPFTESTILLPLVGYGLPMPRLLLLGYEALLSRPFIRTLLAGLPSGLRPISVCRHLAPGTS